MSVVVLNQDTGQYEDNMGFDVGTFDKPYTSLIFIAIHWNGDDFSFLNRLENRMGFKWERWKPFKKWLRPMTFHCFKIEGYRTGSASGSGFRPVEHVAEFPGIDAARFFNKAYLESWQTVQDTDESDEVSKQTEMFCDKLKEFSTNTYSGFLEVLAEEVQSSFRNEISKEQYEWVMSIKDLPAPAYQIDFPEGHPIPEWLLGYEDWLEGLTE